MAHPYPKFAGAPLPPELNQVDFSKQAALLPPNFRSCLAYKLRFLFGGLQVGNTLCSENDVIWLNAHGLASAISLVKTILNYSKLAVSEPLDIQTN